MTEITGAQLRQDFQNRIDGVRARSAAVVADAVRATKDASAALANRDPAAAESLTEMEAADPTAQVGEVEVEVLTLLALEQPVARDLRVLLTARDVAQLGELCLGLCFTLGRRANRVQQVLSDDVRAMILEVGEAAALLLSQANAAWSAIDPDAAESVIASAAESRPVLRRLLAHLASLSDLPVSEALDLGTVVRVYERLTDHAMDIASRVLFAANGTPSSHALRQAQDSLVSATSGDSEPPGQT
jgi:phosphate transport system protein